MAERNLLDFVEIFVMEVIYHRDRKVALMTWPYINSQIFSSIVYLLKIENLILDTIFLWIRKKKRERDKVRFSFRNTLLVLVTFLSFSLICSEKFSFPSSNRRRCFSVDFMFIGRLFKKTTG